MRKLLTTYLLFMVLVVTSSGQTQISDISLLNRSLSYFNPAATGMKEALTANLFYRNQWTGFEGAPSTLFFTANAPLKNPKVALGVKLEHSAIGGTNNTGFYFDYAYRIQLGSNKLSLALEGGLYSMSQKSESLRDDQYDKAMNEDNSSSLLYNVGFGALYYGKSYWISFSVPRFFGYESKETGKYATSVSGVSRDFILAGGGTLPLGSDLGIEPSVFLNYNSGLKFRYVVNAMAVYKKRYEAGLGYRSGGSMIFALAFNINRQITLAYSYDMFFGDVANLGSSAHEVHFQYTFGYKVNAANPRSF